jgi:hypothetical protein
LGLLGAGAYFLLTRDSSEEPELIGGAARESGPGAGTGPTLAGRGPAPGTESPEARQVADTLPAPPPEDPDSVVLVGRVVDERRHPVAGAAVTARVEGYAEAGLRTGADEFRPDRAPAAAGLRAGRGPRATRSVRVGEPFSRAG